MLVGPGVEQRGAMFPAAQRERERESATHQPATCNDDVVRFSHALRFEWHRRFSAPHA